MIVQKIPPDEKDLRNYLGGHFSFLKTLMRGGTGSQRMVYKSGLPLFDTIAAQYTDLNYCNFQQYQEGLAIRMCRRAEGYIAAMRYQEITRIAFFTTPKEDAYIEINVQAQTQAIVLIVPSISIASLRLFATKNFPATLLQITH